MPENNNIRLTTIDVTIGEKNAIAQVSLFKGQHYLCLRFLYIDYKTGELKHSKNGINIPLDDAHEAIDALASVYHEATGQHLCHMPTDDE